MSNSKWLMPSLAVALCAGSASIAVSQTNAPANNAPAAGQPPAGGLQPNQRQMERQRLREQRRQEMQNMTPEQRQELMRQNRVRMLDTALERAGVTDVATRKTITDYIAAEESTRATAQRDIRAALQKLQQAVRTGAVTEAQLSTLLNEYQGTVADEKARRESAARALDTQVGYSKNARLRVLLITMGAIGDEALYVGQGGLGVRGAAGGPGNGNANARGRIGGGAGAAGATNNTAAMPAQR